MKIKFKASGVKIHAQIQYRDIKNKMAATIVFERIEPGMSRHGDGMEYQSVAVADKLNQIFKEWVSGVKRNSFKSGERFGLKKGMKLMNNKIRQKGKV